MVLRCLPPIIIFVLIDFSILQQFPGQRQSTNQPSPRRRHHPRCLGLRERTESDIPSVCCLGARLYPRVFSLSALQSLSDTFCFAQCRSTAREEETETAARRRLDRLFISNQLLLPVEKCVLARWASRAHLAINWDIYIHTNHNTSIRSFGGKRRRNSKQKGNAIRHAAA